MKTFEEKYTAWVDGKLSGSELAEFERELPAEAREEKARAVKLGELLRRHCADAPPLTNPDFFNHQITERITAKTADQPRRARWFQWTLPRMAWAGVACLLVAFTLYQTAVKNSLQPPPTESEYLAKVLEARTEDPSITAKVFPSKENQVTVIWLGGLSYMPESGDL